MRLFYEKRWSEKPRLWLHVLVIEHTVLKSVVRHPKIYVLRAKIWWPIAFLWPLSTPAFASTIELTVN